MPVIMLAAALLAARAPATSTERFWGTWRLVSFARTVTATGETTDVFGKDPRGFITYGPDGRTMVLFVNTGRARPDDVEKLTDAQRAELFKSMVAYAGTYTFDGSAVTHHIDVSANQNWTGSHQVRYVKFEGNRLVLTTAPDRARSTGRSASGR